MARKSTEKRGPKSAIVACWEKEKLVLFHVAAKGWISVQIQSMLYKTEN